MFQKNFIIDLGVVPTIAKSIEIFFDNEGAFSLSKEPWDHKRIRHILIKFHYIWKLVEDEDIIVSIVPSQDSPADPLTKALSQMKHDAHTISISIIFSSELV